MLRRIYAIILIMSLFIALGIAHAHRGHQALSVITVDIAKKKLTVTHRLSAHDIEPVLADISPGSAPSIDDPDSEAALLAYLEKRFAVTGVSLSYDGPEHRGDSLAYIYSGTIPQNMRQLSIRSELFFDQGATSINKLLFRTGSKPVTLVTTPSKQIVTVELSHAQ